MHKRVALISTLTVLLPTAAVAASAADTEPGGGTVVIYSGRTEELVQPILDRFESETGIDVEVRYGDTSDLALLIDEEGDHTPADVFLSQSPGAVGFLDRESRLDTLPDDVLELVPDQFRASNGTWVGVSGRQRVLVYNPELVAESELPTSVLDLVDSDWAERLGVAPANGSFQDFVTAMRIELGDEAATEWLEGIAANDPFTYDGNSAIVAAVGRGEVDAGLVNHYYLFRELAEDPDFPAANHTFAPEDIGSLIIVSAASVLTNADNSDEAAELIRFLLDDEAQHYFSEETFEYPLATDATPSDALPEVDLTALSGISLDLDELGGDLETTRSMIRDAGLEG